MTKEIKIRAWSNEHNRYCDFVTLDENGRWIGWIKSSGVYLTTVDITLEQYTGLKDKNGVAIYDGDIVQLKYRYDGTDIIELASVSFGEIEAELDPDEKFLAWKMTSVADGSYYSILSAINAPDTECLVVGNIHENPELMKGGE